MDVHALFTRMADPASLPEELCELAHDFAMDLNPTSRDELTAALKSLAHRMRLETQPMRIASLSIAALAMVEAGGDSSYIESILFDGGRDALAASARLVDACIEEGLEDRIELYAAEGDEFDMADSDTIAFAQVAEEVAQGRNMDSEWQAFQSLEHMWRPIVSLLARFPRARREQQQMRRHAAVIGEYSEGGYWIDYILGTLDEEPFVVLDPMKRLGFTGRMSGISENVQLLILLEHIAMELGMLPSRPFPDAVLQVVNGRGASYSESTFKAQWTAFEWQALNTNGRLPAPDDFFAPDFEICASSAPEEIPAFDGYRVLVVTSENDIPFWEVQRLFPDMEAAIEIESLLTPEQVGDWLNRMGAAKLTP